MAMDTRPVEHAVIYTIRWDIANLEVEQKDDISTEE